MNKYGLEFHHLGLAVINKEKAVHFVKGLGYIISNEIYDSEQKVNLILCKSKDMPDIEIIFASDEPSPLDNILKYGTELIYHICYTTNNLQYTLDAIRNDNNRLLSISDPKPAVLFSHKTVSFYIVRGFGMIEILEE